MGEVCSREEMRWRMKWPAAWRVLEYVGAGLPKEQTWERLQLAQLYSVRVEYGKDRLETYQESPHGATHIALARRVDTKNR